MTVFYDKNIDPLPIQQRQVCVLGFGAQGRAQALNLRDSGVSVTVGLQPGSDSFATCEAAGVRAAPLGDAVKASDVVVMLVPDRVQAAVYADYVHPALHAGGALIFAHGFAVHYELITPRADLDILMVAPLGIGDKVRSTYVADSGVPALVAVHQDHTGDARALALSYAGANGHGRSGVIETSFAEETETDLFAEQTVLCGGLTHLITAAFETLVDAGYSEEIAYFCCAHEVKLIADLICARGIAGMRRSISATAEYGDYTRGPRVIGRESRAAMQAILGEIRSGAFAKELIQEFDLGGKTLSAGRNESANHVLERVGQQLRATMIGLDAESQV